MLRPEVLLWADGVAVPPSLVRGACLAFALVLPIRSLRLAETQASGNAAAWQVAGIELIQPDASLQLRFKMGLDPGLDVLVSEPALAGRSGPAMLAVTLASADGVPIEAAGPTMRAIFLSGDSMPKDNYFAELLRPTLRPFFVENLQTEAELLAVPPEARLGGSVALRTTRLAKLVESEAGRPGSLILIGRSAGGRVASSFADSCEARGVVCLGFPFRHPKMHEEPSRYRHLATLRTPTLIIQGKRDPYGGAEAAWRYPRSSRVDMAVIDTNHDFRMQDAAWRLVGRRILLFLAHRCGPAPADRT